MQEEYAKLEEIDNKDYGDDKGFENNYNNTDVVNLPRAAISRR